MIPSVPGRSDICISKAGFFSPISLFTTIIFIGLLMEPEAFIPHDSMPDLLLGLPLWDGPGTTEIFKNV